MKSKTPRVDQWFLLSLAGFLWAAVAVAGFRTLLIYQTTPGTAAKPPAQWPTNSPISRVPGHFTLVLLAHPQCPCSRASIGELAWIMARAQDKMDGHVFFFKPSRFPKDWEKTDLWSSAAAIPGVRVYTDQGGAVAKLFRAATSGQVLLYDQAGHLAFNGGITDARGHSGANAGRNSVLAFLRGERGNLPSAPVFGCSLLDSDQEKMDAWKPWKS